MTRRKRPPSKPPPPEPPPPEAAPRRVNLGKPIKEQIGRLRQDAYTLVDFPELLDQPQWRLRALRIAEAFIAQNPQPPPGRPRSTADLVDESIDSQLKRGVPLADAVEKARDFYAELLGKKRDAVKRAHLRYGKRGVTKAR